MLEKSPERKLWRDVVKQAVEDARKDDHVDQSNNAEWIYNWSKRRNTDMLPDFAEICDYSNFEEGMVQATLARLYRDSLIKRLDKEGCQLSKLNITALKQDLAKKRRDLRKVGVNLQRLVEVRITLKAEIRDSLKRIEWGKYQKERVVAKRFKASQEGIAWLVERSGYKVEQKEYNAHIMHLKGQLNTSKRIEQLHASLAQVEKELKED